MKRFILGFTWGFVVGVAVMDIYFTWQCRHSVPEWEANPAARAVYRYEGTWGAIGYRLAWLAYAGVMAASRTRLSWLVTPVWTAGHVYLLVTLLQAYPYLESLRG